MVARGKVTLVRDLTDESEGSDFDFGHTPPRQADDNRYPPTPAIPNRYQNSDMPVGAGTETTAQQRRLRIMAIDVQIGEWERRMADAERDLETAKGFKSSVSGSSAARAAQSRIDICKQTISKLQNERTRLLAPR